MTETASADITVTTVRKALIKESHGHHAATRRYSPPLKAGQNPTRADSDALEGQAAAAAYSYLLAAVLRQIEAFSGTAEATEMARLINAVMDAGTEALEDANSDLDERARAATHSRSAAFHHGAPVETPAAAKPLVHFTIRGLCGVCGADTRSVPGPLTLAWDEADDTIDCPPCRMYLDGLRAGRGGAR